jgi:hypothetical protein
MTVWISEARAKDLEHFTADEAFEASGCYLYLIKPHFGYEIHSAPASVSGRTALQWLLTNSTRKNGLRSLKCPPPEDIDFNKVNPMEVLVRLGAIPGPPRNIVTLYWPIQPSDDQMFTLGDGRRCRSYDLIGYPIFIAEV